MQKRFQFVFLLIITVLIAGSFYYFYYGTPGSIPFLPQSKGFTSSQLSNIPQCITANLYKVALPASYACKLGQDIGDYSIASSIEPDHTILFDKYDVPNAQVSGGRWSPHQVRLGEQQVVWDQCMRKATISRVSTQSFDISITADDSKCSM